MKMIETLTVGQLQTILILMFVTGVACGLALCKLIRVLMEK